jgi:hypothetical protein
MPRDGLKPKPGPLAVMQHDSVIKVFTTHGVVLGEHFPEPVVRTVQRPFFVLRLTQGAQIILEPCGKQCFAQGAAEILPVPYKRFRIAAPAKDTHVPPFGLSRLPSKFHESARNMAKIIAVFT